MVDRPKSAEIPNQIRGFDDRLVRIEMNDGPFRRCGQFPDSLSFAVELEEAHVNIFELRGIGLNLPDIQPGQHILNDLLTITGILWHEYP